MKLFPPLPLFEMPLRVTGVCHALLDLANVFSKIPQAITGSGVASDLSLFSFPTFVKQIHDTDDIMLTSEDVPL